MVLTQYSKMLISVYLDKYFIFHIKKWPKICYLTYPKEFWRWLICCIWPQMLKCLCYLRPLLVALQLGVYLFMMTIGQGIIQVLSLISRSFLIEEWPIKSMSYWTGWPCFFLKGISGHIRQKISSDIFQKKYSSISRHAFSFYLNISHFQHM